MVFGGLIILVVVVVVMLIRSFVSDSDEPVQRRVQQISLIQPPPPPPPPPEVKPPEPRPQDIKEEVKQEQPPPQTVQTNQPPPGIGGAGYGNGDTSFGGSGGWMGSGSSRFGYYLGGVQKGIHDELDRNKKLHKREYKVDVALWLDKSGAVSRIELLSSSGDKELDALMKSALSGARFDEPPSDMPQPIKLRISSS